MILVTGARHGLKVDSVDSFESVLWGLHSHS